MISRSLFGNRLKEQRKFLGLTQAQAAEKAGIERETWGKYERGVFMPSGDVLISFLSMGINVSKLFMDPTKKNEANPNEEETKLLECYRTTDSKGRAALMAVAVAVACEIK